MMRGMLRARERATVSPYFPVGGPVPAPDLVGREAYLRRLVERLEDGNHVLVAGPRRIGKTSIILEALRRLKRRGAHTHTSTVSARPTSAASASASPTRFCRTSPVSNGASNRPRPSLRGCTPR